MKVYVDSNIFLNYLFNEFGGITEFAALRTEELFEKALNGKYTLFTSELTVFEVSDISRLSENEVKEFLQHRNVNIVKVMLSDKKQAENITQKTKIHTKDAIHTAIALRCGCEAIITRDIKDFKKVSHLIKVCKPEEL